MFSIVLLYAVCASTFTICKALLAYVKPLFLVGVRMLVAGMLLLGYSYFQDKRTFFIHRKDRLLFFQIILFHVYFAYILDLWSLQYLTSFKSSFLYNFSPFLAALFSYFCFSEKMTLKKWLGLGIGFCGFAPEIIANIDMSSFSSATLLPEFIMLFAVGSAVYGWVTMRKLVKDGEYSPIMVNGIGMVGGGILALLTSYFIEGWTVSPVTDFWPFVRLTALIILLANIIFYNFYGYLLKHYTATFLAFAGFTTPFFAALFGWLFLGERVSVSFFMSLVVVCIGLYIFYHEELKQGYMITAKKA